MGHLELPDLELMEHLVNLERPDQVEHLVNLERPDQVEHLVLQVRPVILMVL